MQAKQSLLAPKTIMKGGENTMTLTEFKEIIDTLYYYANAGAYPKELDAFPEDEQESFFKGYETALRDFFAELAMDKLPENQQIAVLKGYRSAMHEILQELQKLLDC